MYFDVYASSYSPCFAFVAGRKGQDGAPGLGGERLCNRMNECFRTPSLAATLNKELGVRSGWPAGFSSGFPVSLMVHAGRCTRISAEILAGAAFVTERRYSPACLNCVLLDADLRSLVCDFGHVTINQSINRAHHRRAHLLLPLRRGCSPRCWSPLRCRFSRLVYCRRTPIVPCQCPRGCSVM